MFFFVFVFNQLCTFLRRNVAASVFLITVFNTNKIVLITCQSNVPEQSRSKVSRI